MGNLMRYAGALLIAAALSGSGWSGTWTQNQFIYKPSLGARGAQEKAQYDAGLDRVDARLAKTVWLGDPGYGPSLPEALSAIGSRTVGLRIPAGSHAVAGNLTVPANVALHFENGAVLTVATGVTLTINSPLVAPESQVFGLVGTGVVKFGNNLTVVKPEWWGVTGTNDEAAINAAIQAAPLGGTVHFLPKTYYIASKISLNRNVTLAGSGLSHWATSTGQTIIDATAVTGAAIEVSSVSGVTKDHRLRDFWLYAGTGSSPSTVTKGIEIKGNCSGWALERVRVSGVTQSQDGAGAYYGIYAGAESGGFSGRVDGCYVYNCDIGVYLGEYGQHTMLLHAKITSNYTYGVQLKDCESISLIACQIEKNGKIANSTASVFLDGTDAVSFLGCYNEQNSSYPGAAVIVGTSAGSVCRGVFFDSGTRFLGNNQATKAIIVKKAEDFNSFARILNFTEADISYEPWQYVSGINNITNHAMDFGTTNVRSAMAQGYINLVNNPFLEKWHDAANAVYWTNSTRGTFSRDTDAGRMGSYNLKMVGDGSAGEVSATQTIQAVGDKLASTAGGYSLLLYYKCPNANAVTSRIRLGNRSLTLTKSDSWQWRRVSMAPGSFSGNTVKMELCDSSSTAQASDVLLVGYVGVFPGWSLPPGVIGQPSEELRGSLSWDPDNLANGAGQTSADITVTGATLGDKVEVGAPYDLQGLICTGYVKAANTVVIRLHNGTGGNVNLGSGAWRVVVRK